MSNTNSSDTESNVTQNGTTTNDQEQEKSRLVGPIGTVLMMVYLTMLAIALLYGFIRLWPSSADPSSITPQQVTFFFGTFSVSSELRLLLIVALSGALGSIVHTLRSFYWYVGNRDLKYSWLPMYFERPFVAATLAIIVYLVIRGGFFSPAATVEETSPFSFAALAALVGMFSGQAALKLKDIAETLFTKPKPGQDSVPQQEQEEKPKSDTDEDGEKEDEGNANGDEGRE